MLIFVFLVLGFASYTTTTPLSDDDFLGGPDVTLSGEAALTVLDARLTPPLPYGTEVLGFTEGGFQDVFWQIKLRLADADVAAALSSLGSEGLVPFQTDIFALPDDGWWNPGELAGQQVGNGQIPGFAGTQILTAPDPQSPGHMLIFVFAFQM